MSSNRLKLNTSKTQFMWLGGRQQVTKAQIHCQTLTLDGVENDFYTELVCIGVVFDPELTFAVHIRRLAGKCFYHLRQLRTVRRTLTTDAAKTLVHAFITSRMDYCNSVLAMPVLFICTHFNRWCTLLRASSRGKESTTIFLQQSIISYTGCQLYNGLTTSCALLFTSAYTM